MSDSNEINEIDGRTDAKELAEQTLEEIKDQSPVDVILNASAALASENIAPDPATMRENEEAPVKSVGAEAREHLQKAAKNAAVSLSEQERKELIERVRFNAPYAGNLNAQDFEELLVHCTKIGASDIHIKTDDPIVIELAGQYVPVVDRALRAEEITCLLTMLYGSHAETQVKSGDDLDKAYSLRVKGSRYRFRVNITGCDVRGFSGSQTTIRTIRADPMRLTEMRVEEGIAKNYNHKDGLVVICGPTGSGKSSLLAGIITEILENPESHKKIITYEKPIEYVYDMVPKPSSIIVQTEMGTHLVGKPGMPEFELAVRNALRRAPKILLVGETRDKGTMDASLEAAQTGHLLYTTLHTNNSVGEAIYRMLNLFPREERDSKLSEILNALRLIVIQRLERSTTGGRVPIREFLAFRPEMLDQLLRVDNARDLVLKVNEFVEQEGQTLAQSAEHRYLEGLLPYKTYLAYCKSLGRNPLPPQFNEVAV